MTRYQAQTSEWQEDGYLQARCYAHRCDFAARTGDVEAAAKRHAEQTGHEVQITRSQFKVVMGMEREEQRRG